MIVKMVGISHFKEKYKFKNLFFNQEMVVSHTLRNVLSFAY